jgi:hypothetical protein
VQGYFGGWTDLLFQRFIEVWTSIPSLYLLIIISSVITPSFFVLLGILLLFSWVSLVGVVRAEFLRARNFEYVRAARALGLSNAKIMVKHLLPNAMVATLTFMPFVLNGSITTLTSLDFLGFGLPPGSPSLGELLAQGKNNLRRPGSGLRASRDLADAVAAGLHRRSGARCVRSAQDASRSRRSRSCKLLPYPLASHPSGSIRFGGRELLGAGEATLRKVRGNDITMMFQEPMTSLNPLHTIEKQIGEALLIHKGLSGEAARARIVELLELVGIRDAAQTARRLSAPALRRHVPARDDRHGAGLRARTAHRRRADHRSRRHDPGADPETAQGTAASSAWRCCSSPMTSASCAALPTRDGDEQGQDRRGRAGGRGVRRAAA